MPDVYSPVVDTVRRQRAASQPALLRSHSAGSDPGSPAHVAGIMHSSSQNSLSGAKGIRQLSTEDLFSTSSRQAVRILEVDMVKSVGGSPLQGESPVSRNRCEQA